MNQDKAEKAAEALLKPSEDRLEARKEKLARRLLLNGPAFYSITPAFVAAIATALSMVYLEISPITAVVFGTAMGWGLSGTFARSDRQSRPDGQIRERGH